MSSVNGFISDANWILFTLTSSEGECGGAAGLIAWAGRIRARASVVGSVQGRAGVLVVGGAPRDEEIFVMCNRSLTSACSV